MEYEDYTAYSDLSDEELIQLAIQRSLTEGFLESSNIPPPPAAPRIPSPRPRPSSKNEYDSPPNTLCSSLKSSNTIPS